MEVTGYIADHIEIATYKGDMVLIIHTKQDLPTVVVLSDEEVEELITDLKSRQRGIFSDLWKHWDAAVRRRQEKLF